MCLYLCTVFKRRLQWSTIDGKPQRLNTIMTSTTFVFLCFDITAKSEISASDPPHVLLTVSTPKKSCFWWNEDKVETWKHVNLCNSSQLIWICLVKNDKAQCQLFPLEACWDVSGVFFPLVLSLKHLINQFYVSGWIYQSEAAVLNKE